MPINKQELSKLSPENRIKKLKSMEEEKKREVGEIGELIKKSMQELKTAKIADDITPEHKPVDISRLFETTGEQRLERTAKQETSPFALTKGAKAYQVLSEVYESYTKLRQFYSIVSAGGSLTEEERNLVGQIGERINKAERYSTAGEKTTDILDASRAIIYKLEQEKGLPRRWRS